MASMHLSYFLSRRLAVALLLTAGLFTPAPSSAMSLDFDTQGAATLENSLVQLRVSNRPDSTQGVMGWRFKPTGFEMVDVLYYHMEAGHLAGLRWDSTPIGEIRGGTSATGDLFVPRFAALTEDGRVIVLRQSAEGTYRLTRTLILRRDHAALEIRVALENLAAPNAPLDVAATVGAAWQLVALDQAGAEIGRVTSADKQAN